MARAIDAEKTKACIQNVVEHLAEAGNEEMAVALSFAIEIIDNAKTIDAVKRGKWLCEWDSSMGTTEVTCSVCKSSREILGCYVGVHGEHLYDEDDYCPKCGADMRGE